MSEPTQQEIARLLALREGLHTELAMIEWRISELRDPLGLQTRRKAFWESTEGIRQDFQRRLNYFERLNRGKR